MWNSVNHRCDILSSNHGHKRRKAGPEGPAFLRCMEGSSQPSGTTSTVTTGST